MNDLLKKIMFNSVFVVILFHIIIPHPHSDEIDEKEHLEIHKNSRSLYGILRFVFHESNDESLDNLLVAQDLVVKNNPIKYPHPIVAYNKNEFVIVKATSISDIRIIENFTKLFIVNLYRVRGPPFIT